ncbi:MAG: MerR family transcriptional regulator [Christensenellales bacterium]|nr:MerR family transcriptional regulator [Christensenellales bacterium]
MEKFFSIKKAAEITGLTAETLRHYDRIGLVKPAAVSPDTKYRYYTQKEVIRLNTVHALRCMDFSLERIRAMLGSEDFGEIVAMLKEATENADKKIAELTEAKARIERAKSFYEAKAARNEEHGEPFVRTLPARTILLSDSLHTPTMDNLYDYHRHFYTQVGWENRDKFGFEDAAGVYLQDGRQNMFAVCTKHTDTDGIVTLPAGKWLCAACDDGDRDAVRETLCAEARKYGCDAPPFCVQMVVLTGILQWKYELQLPLTRPCRSDAEQQTP